MSKNTKATRSALLLAAAIVLVGAGTIGATRALPSADSATHKVDAATSSIDVAIIENGIAVEGELALDGIDDEVLLGKTYDETVDVKNTGDIDSYIRVTVKKYWTDADGKKNLGVDPELIQIKYDDEWTATAETAERTVLYYPDVVASGDIISLIESVTISKDVASKATVTVDKEKKVRTVSFAYDDMSFNIEVTADSVQTHNADKAIMSVWGVDPTDVGINVAE